ncbi:MAG: aldehyde dehydrogenase family protein [Betaproteobacteria bacterium]
MNASTEPSGLLIGGEWVHRPGSIEVRNPFDGAWVATVTAGTRDDVAAAVAAARASLAIEFPLHARCDVLMRAAALIETKQEEYARQIAIEGSKTIREARREPPRAATILRLSAGQAQQVCGETLPFDSRPGSENRVGYYFRVPVGVVAAIMPFNDPLAVFAHKVGPALAAGNAVVVKPASATPLSALRAAADLMAAGLPPGRLNVVTGRGEEVGAALAADPRVRLLTFTGGAATGERLTRVAGVKKLLLELGSNSPVIVLDDARLGQAADAIVAGAFAQAGQNCLGVQRVFVHEAVYEPFRREVVERTARLKAGSSLDETVDVCAMISERQAARLDSWIAEAVSGGARVLVGNRRQGTVVWPTVLEEVPRGVRLDCAEAYGPVMSLYRASSLDEAIERANAVDYGLHAAIFTERLRDAFAAARQLEVGAVIVNDSTDYRLDVMPFGGTKSSGVGREGVRFAIEEMTETRVVCLNL